VHPPLRGQEVCSSNFHARSGPSAATNEVGTIVRAVAPTPIRDRKAGATRARIAAAALELFVSRGFAETTIDQIATAAGVGRRTIFHHFATKEEILFDHLVVRRDAAVEMLRERPPTEPVLVSLHAVLRELCVEGYDRRALAQIRDVLALNPGLAGQQFAVSLKFEANLTAAIQNRHSELSKPEIYALTLMALSWLTAATRIYLRQNRRSLVKCFDEIAAACLRSAIDDLAPSLGASPVPGERSAKHRSRARA
jgi:AcrR family transcriptional regulator